MEEENNPIRVATELGRLSEAVRGIRDDLVQADIRRDKLHSGLHEVAKLVQSTIPRIDSILEAIADNKAAIRSITPIVHDHERRISSAELDIKDLKVSTRDFLKDKYIRVGVLGTIAAAFSFFGLELINIIKDIGK